MMAMVTLKAIAHPWHCDQMGHMNVRHYAAFFDDASFQLLGYLAGPDAPSHLGWADVRLETEFKNETPAGTLLTVETVVTKIGNSSLQARHVMTDSVSGQVLAQMTGTTVRFDLTARGAVPLDAGLRARAEALLV